MMKIKVLAAIAATALLVSPARAQLDLGGAISGAINGATGNAQAAPKAAVDASAAANANAAGALNQNAVGQTAGQAAGQAGLAPAVGNQNASQGWLGRVGNDIRGALQQADNGVMRLQNNLNPSLQQYGLRPGDQLLDANGQPLTQTQFDQYLQSNPNQLRVLRNGQTVVLNGNTAGNFQGNGQVYNQSNQMGSQMSAQMGSQGRFQASSRQRFGITMNPAGDGVMVSAVTVGSPAAQAGIRPGDQIVSVNGQPVANPNAMIQLVGSAAADQALDVQFRRNGQVMQSQVMLASNASGQNNVYQAGYAQGNDGRASGQSGQASADVNARIEQLEKTVQELRDEIRQLSKPSDK